jgi:alpha-glucosidase (family GH31 glycosyl hydrolase)
MKWSIAGVMNFNMFGIPMVGPDTCGFFEDQALNQTEQRELCARWIQLSAFYPFARQNYDTATLPEGMGLEPYNLGGKEYNNTANNTVYADWAKDAIKERFKYLRHMYTCQLKVHREGGTCFDPLLFHYPHDDEVFKTDNTEHSFIIGDALKITPVLDWGVTDVMSYFPTGRWVDMKSFGPTYLVNSNGSLPA